MSNSRGVDLSHFNTNLQFHEIAQTCDFVFLKATQSTGFVDPTFAGYRHRARECNLRVGAYHFLDPSQDGFSQATHFLSVFGDLQSGELAPAIDVESTPGWNADKIQVVEDFAAAIIATFGECKIYASPGWWEGTFAGTEWSNYPNILQCDLWVAEYGVIAPHIMSPFSIFQIWQYGEAGTVLGAGSADVDTDQWNGTIAKLGST
jgi:lysozyme